MGVAQETVEKFLAHWNAKEINEACVEYRVYMLDDLRIEFIFRVAAERFDEFLPAFDSIVSSFRME